ncbi:MAG: hypothetical protein KF729_33450 [Sandaracinaceae bacterium]|nr:hypothetical protein [Sandaracinaceae bacterium]
MNGWVARIVGASVGALALVSVASAQEFDDVIVAQPPPRPVVTPAAGAPLVPEGGVPPVGMPIEAPVARPEPPPPRPAPPPLPPPAYSLELQVRVAFPEESSFDVVMSSFGYRGVRVEPVVYVGAQFPVLEWLWLGGRVGMRGRHWTHRERDPAVATAGDLLLTAQVRLALGRVVELGAIFGGGAGVVFVEMNGVTADQIVARFSAEALVAFRVGANFALGPRIGWDYFQWENMNRYGHGLDLGGFFFGLAVEGRE